jgi:hypothetical protein
MGVRANIIVHRADGTPLPRMENMLTWLIPATTTL